MSQYSRYPRAERALIRSSQYGFRNDAPPTGRAWTIVSDQRPDGIVRQPAAAGPSPSREDRQSRTPSHRSSSSRHPSDYDNDHNRGSEPPARIRSPSPSAQRRYPVENAPTFHAWLQSNSGPNLTPENADGVIATMRWDDLLHNERKAAFERSVAAQGRTVYSESVYSSQAPPPLQGARQGPLPPPSRHEGSEANDRTKSCVTDVRRSEASRSQNGDGSRRKR